MFADETNVSHQGDQIYLDEQGAQSLENMLLEYLHFTALQVLVSIKGINIYRSASS